MSASKDLLVERFLRYVRVNTKSDDSSTDVPSTSCQKDLQKILVEELRALGLVDAAMDAHGIVFATLPGNVSGHTKTIGLIAHVDTSPDMSGENVTPVIHRQYDGGTLRLGGDWTLSPVEYPPLADHVGCTLITSDGTTLLGADDKAGVAEIMTALEYFVRHPEVKRPTVRVAFTCDEEVGRGTDHFDVKRFGAHVAYTVDGGGVPGEIEDETFSADGATIVFRGKNVHPGYAKGKMVNALKVASLFVASLPQDKAPETTDGRQGFVHPVAVQGGVDEARVKLILRSFTDEGLEETREMVRRLASESCARWSGSSCEVEISESYRNMGKVLREHPRSVEIATQAVRLAGMEPRRAAIRGGTDGARLSFMGLPTPNVFTGGHLYHSRFEWVAVETMHKAVDTLKQIVMLWAKEQ